MSQFSLSAIKKNIFALEKLFLFDKNLSKFIFYAIKHLSAINLFRTQKCWEEIDFIDSIHMSHAQRLWFISFECCDKRIIIIKKRGVDTKKELWNMSMKCY